MSGEHYLIKSEVRYGLVFVREIREHLPKVDENVIVYDDEGKRYVGKMHSVEPRIDRLTDLYTNHPSIDIGDKVVLTANPDKSLKLSFIKSVDNSEEEMEIPLGLEKALEDFLESHLEHIEKGLKLYHFKNGDSGRQHKTDDAGRPDLICSDKDGKFVIIELKKEKGSDETVGQITRYMGWAKENLSNNQPVRGIIIVRKVNKGLEYSASAVPNVQIKYYKINLNFVSKQEADVT